MPKFLLAFLSFSWFRHEWRTSNWSPCSITCGAAGTKSRTISCYQFRYNDDGTLFEPESEVAVGFCHEEDKPADITDCQGRPCPAEWKTGKWGEVCLSPHAAYTKYTASMGHLNCLWRCKIEKNWHSQAVTLNFLSKLNNLVFKVVRQFYRLDQLSL